MYAAGGGFININFRVVSCHNLRFDERPIQNPKELKIPKIKM